MSKQVILQGGKPCVHERIISLPRMKSTAMPIIGLGSALQLEYEGTKCTASTLIQVLLLAASRVVSIFAACRDLADAPSRSDDSQRFGRSLAENSELERRLNLSLVTKLAQGVAAQVAQDCHRSDADSLSRSAASRREGNLSQCSRSRAPRIFTPTPRR